MRKMTSLFPGECACGAAVDAGAEIMFDPSARPKVRKCPACDFNLALPAALRIIQARIIREFWRDPKRGERAGVRMSLVRGTVVPPGTLNADGTPVVFERDPIEKGAEFSSFLVLPAEQTSPGATLELHGQWENGDRGWLFKSDKIEPIVEEGVEGLAAYLTTLPRIGEKIAGEIAKIFDGDAGKCFEALERADPLFLKVKGISQAAFAQILEAFQAQKTQRDSILTLGSLGITGRMAARAFKHYDDQKMSVKDEVARDPFCLLDVKGFGWVRVDAASRKMSIALDDPRRLAAALAEVVKEECGEGHTFCLVEAFLHKSNNVNFGGGNAVVAEPPATQAELANLEI